MDLTKKPGDAVQITRDYLDSLLVEMRLIDSVLPSTALELFGEHFATPIMTAALSHLGGCHPDGMVELARGAAQADAVLWAGMGDEAELEAIVATGAKTIKIIKPYADNDMIFRKLEHARRCGVLAVGMDIDHAFSRNGDYDSVHGLEMRPKTREELAEFVKAAELPFLIKGVLSVRDAVKCAEAGVSGIVVSHHHGILPYAAPPLLLLPEIKRAVGGRMKLFVDCGIERGMDVFKAIALGADAVSVGRALMGPLKEGGAAAVAQAIHAMNAELSQAMAMTGASDLRGIDPDVIRTI